MPMLNRRHFLGTSAAAAGAFAFAPRAFAQSGELKMWTPGGSDLFCQIHTGLIQGFASRTEGFSGATVQCGLGQDTEFTQALIASIASGSPPTSPCSGTAPSRWAPKAPSCRWTR